MNTTSMEFVICQEKTNKSPIVLSEFMGISHNMTHALYVRHTVEYSVTLLTVVTRRQINPWNLGVRRCSPSHTYSDT
jgi:hypothetical protein